MRPVARLADRWPNMPMAAGVIALLLLAIGIVVEIVEERDGEGGLRSRLAAIAGLEGDQLLALEIGRLGEQRQEDQLAVDPRRSPDRRDTAPHQVARSLGRQAIRKLGSSCGGRRVKHRG